MIAAWWWRRALADHDAAVRALAAALAGVPDDAWARPPRPGGWSPAAVALHVCVAYELGAAAPATGAGMRLRVPRAAAWLSRTLLLPALVLTGTFPRGARAPREVVPDPAEAAALTRAAALARLERAAAAAAAALHAAAGRRPPPRVRHAYFGALTPRATLRLLSAHTRHHARALAAASGRAGAP